MATYTENALYGPGPNLSAINAQMLNPAYAQGETDWGAVMANGIRGATQGAIAGLVAEKYASGQLVSPNNPQALALPQNNMLMWLLVGGAVYMLAKG